LLKRAFNANNTSSNTIYHGGGGLSTKKYAAARDPRLRSSSAARCEAAELAPGGVGEVLFELLGEVPGEVLALPPRVAGAGKSRQGPPQTSSHGSAIPRRSSHFGDRGASLLGCRLRVRPLAKVSKRRDAGQPRLR